MLWRSFCHSYTYSKLFTAAVGKWARNVSIGAFGVAAQVCLYSDIHPVHSCSSAPVLSPFPTMMDEKSQCSYCISSSDEADKFQPSMEIKEKTSPSSLIKGEVDVVRAMNSSFEMADLLSESCPLHQSSQSDSDSFGVNLLFDMAKVVEDVKMKLKEKRQKKKMPGKVSSSGGQNLQSSSNETSEKVKGKERSTETTRVSSTDHTQSDSDFFGLRCLFEARKMEEKQKRKRKKARKIQKCSKLYRKSKESESFGLDVLFDESNSTSNNKRKRKKRVRKYASEDTDNSDEDGELHESSPVKAKKKKPNYFVAIRISNPNIHSAVTDFQASVLKENSKLSQACIPLPMLHLTMAVMHLDEASVEIAKTALQKCREKVIQILKDVDFRLSFTGVGHFRHEVIYAKVGGDKCRECLNSMNNVITTTLEGDGICASEEKEWTPHLTLLKLSRKRALRKKGIRKVNEETYASWTEVCFGEEMVEKVHLCSMFGSKEKDGFYRCEASISVCDNS